jgi:N-acetyl-anhydromuramyl-L-alanine amidase AmpD
MMTQSIFCVVRRAPQFHFGVLLIPTLLAVAGCKTVSPPAASAERWGDEIVVAGQFFRTGTPVVLWMDSGGFDAYRPVEPRPASVEAADSETSDSPRRRARPSRLYSQRRGSDWTDAESERVRREGWDLPTLQKVVDQFVIHYDVAGTSRNCFNVLQRRGISVHFLLDLDGTIYQTLDAQEAAWHATIANHRSVGIEIANIGAYRNFEKSPLRNWYGRDEDGNPIVTLPKRLVGHVRTPGFVARPARSEPVMGPIQNGRLTQYDFTPEQYKALSHLVAALSTALPQIQCDYPRDADGNLVTRKLPEEEWKAFRGVLGHYHVQSNKVDPGPAFQWDYILEHARKLMLMQPEAGPVAQR